MMENNQTSVAVIIRTAGVPERLSPFESLLASLLKQSFKDFRLIVACETNSSGIRGLVQKYFGDNAMVIETNKWNRCKTINQAIRLADEDILVLLDDDFVLEPEWLTIVLQTFNIAPNVGCVCSPMPNLYREGLLYKAGVKARIIKIFIKLAINNSWVASRSRPIDRDLVETPVFGVCVACKRKALFDAGLFDENIEEPVAGDDFDLAFRIRKRGYIILKNTNVKAFHNSRYVSKRVKENPRFFEVFFFNDMYTFSKHLDLFRFYILPHICYRIAEGLIWTARTRKLRTVLHVAIGIARGFWRGFKEYSVKTRKGHVVQSGS